MSFYSTASAKLKENFQKNQQVLKIQSLGLLAHSTCFGVYLYAAHNFSAIGSAAGRLLVGAVWLIVPLALKNKVMKKGWLLYCLLWYAVESGGLVIDAYRQIATSMQPLWTASTSTAIQLALALFVVRAKI